MLTRCPATRKSGKVKGQKGPCGLSLLQNSHRFFSSAQHMAPPTSTTLGLGSPHPHSCRDRARPTHICTGTWLAPPTFSQEVGSPHPTSAPRLGVLLPRLHPRWARLSSYAAGEGPDSTLEPREYPSTSNASAPACGYPVREYPVSTLADLSASPTPSARPRAGAYAPPRPRAAATYISICVCVCICICISICISTSISL